MAIWVSRYSNKELQQNKDRYYPVGVSIGQPKFSLGYQLREQCYSLAPKGYMLNMDMERFKPAYYEKLENIGTDRIINMVTRLDEQARSEGKELVLLCYEDVRVPEDWCHRTMFAEWWAENVGELIKELPDPMPVKYKKLKAEKTEKSQQSIKSSEYKQMSLIG